MKKMLAVVLVLVVTFFLISPAFSQEAAKLAPTKEQIVANAAAKVLEETEFNFLWNGDSDFGLVFNEKGYHFTLPNLVQLKYSETEYWVFLPFDSSKSGNLLSHPERRVHKIALYTVPNSEGACGARTKAIILNQLVVRRHKQAEATLSRPLSVLTNAFSKGLGKGSWKKISEKEFKDYQQLRKEWLVAHPDNLPPTQVAQNK